MQQSKNMRRGHQDRISSLPDCLLHLIMSFLTAQQAVRMCVLSKRWKNLWTTLPFLNFDLSKFRYNWRAWEDDESEDDEYEIECRLFRNFVNMTLLLRKPTDLLKFRLSCSEMSSELYGLFTRSWIRYALDKNPQVLDINTSIEDSLPVGVFTCVSLVDLSLSCCLELEGKQFPVVNLPRIKRLHLHSLHLNQDSMKNLLYGCPVLEFLHLQGCNLEFSSIQSQSLKHLEIQGWCHWEPGLMTDIIMESIDAPNLLSFCYRGCVQYIGRKLLLNMPSLTSAILYMERCTSHKQFSGNRKVLIGISSVETVKLSGSLIKEFLKAELPSCPIFPNMKELSLNDLCLSCDFNVLASFLEHLPNLKTLSLYHCHCRCLVRKKQEPFKIAPFKCELLQTVDIRFYKCNNDFHWIMKYILDGTENLRAEINMTCSGGTCFRHSRC